MAKADSKSSKREVIDKKDVLPCAIDNWAKGSDLTTDDKGQKTLAISWEGPGRDQRAIKPVLNTF